MFNSSLLTPRNIAVIGIISVAAHMLLKPFYKLIQGSKS